MPPDHKITQVTRTVQVKMIFKTFPLRWEHKLISINLNQLLYMLLLYFSGVGYLWICVCCDDIYCNF